MRRGRTIPGAGLPLVALLALAGCEVFGPGSPLDPFTDVAFLPDGRALVVQGASGIFLAAPPEAEPRQALDTGCGGTLGRLDCIRASPDGERVAVLIGRRESEAGPVWRLMQLVVRDAEGRGYRAGQVADDVLDATYTPDGRELLFARRGAEDGTIALYRALADGSEDELVRSIPVGGQASPWTVLRSVVPTSYGVVYPRPVGDSVQVWFRPFGGPLLDLGGRLALSCRGTAFRGCVLGSLDGGSFSWQDRGSAIVHVYRAQRQADLPLGVGSAFAFSRSGSLGLRVGSGAAYVQSIDTAVVARAVPGVLSAELSADGEVLARLAQESKAENSVRLFIGPSRQEGRDHDYGVFLPTVARPFLSPALGSAPVAHAFTPDGRFVIVSAGTEGGGTELVAVNESTAARTVLGSFTCAGCCATAPEGALVVCLPDAASASAGTAVELYDPATGSKTVASTAAVDVRPVFDGRGVALLESRGGVPQLKVASKGGAVRSLGAAFGFSLSPVGARLAFITDLGRLQLQDLE